MQNNVLNSFFYLYPEFTDKSTQEYGLAITIMQIKNISAEKLFMARHSYTCSIRHRCLQMESNAIFLSFFFFFLSQGSIY